MDIVNRARNILLRPGPEWAAIDVEPASARALYTQYLIPLGLIGPIASFIGLTIIGISIPFIGTYRTPLVDGITSAIVSFAAVLVGVYVWARIIDALAPTFGGTRSLDAALKVAVFAATPALLAGILSLLPALAIVQLFAALYGVYLLYRGLPILMKAPANRALSYTAVTIVCGVVVGMVLGALLMALHVSPLFGRTAGMSNAAQQTVAQSAIVGALGAAAGAAAAAKDTAPVDTAAQPASRAGGADASDPNAAGAAAAGIAAIGALVGGGKAHVATVDFRTLEHLLPASIGSLTRSDARGEKTNAAGLGVSMAEAVYRDGANGDLRVKISDMGNASGVLALGALALSAETESDSGYEKNVVAGNRRVHEKWTTAGKTSELTSVAGDRFLIEINGTGLDMPVAERAMAALDFDTLAKLKS